MANEVKKTKRDGVDYGAQREKAQDALGDLLDEAVRLDESGVSRRLDQKNVQAAKRYYTWWIKKQKENLFRPFAAAGLLIAIIWMSNEPENWKGNIGMFLGFWALYSFYRAQMEIDTTNMYYVTTLLGRITHLGKDWKRYRDGITLEVFGKIEEFKALKFLIAYLIPAIFVSAGFFFLTRSQLLGDLLLSLGAISGIVAIIMEYRGEKNETDDNE